MMTKMSNNTAEILSGKEFAEGIKREVAEDVKKLEAKHGFRPALTVVRVGEDKASEVYVTNKVKTSAETRNISEQASAGNNFAGRTSENCRRIKQRRENRRNSGAIAAAENKLTKSRFRKDKSAKGR